jgi:hypothetical protein
MGSSRALALRLVEHWYLSRRSQAIAALTLLFRYEENSGDCTHAEAHFRASKHFLARCFCKNELKKKDFQENLRLPWSQGRPVQIRRPDH